MHWNSDFREPRYAKEFFPWNSDFRDFRFDKFNLNEAIYYDKSFHDDLDDIPKSLNSVHTKAMINYTSSKSTDIEGYGSSHNINSYLQNRSGNKTKKS